MIKKVLLITLVLIYGCSSSVDKDKIRSQIKKKKDTIVSLQTEIRELEEKLAANGLADETRRTLVSIKKIEPVKFEHFHSVNGTVEAVKDAFISPEISGRIKNIYVSEGQRVNKNDLLAELNSGVVKSSISELKSALDLANILFKKREGLWKKNIGSEIQYLESKNQKESLEKKIGTLKEQLSMTMIRSPFSGIVDNIERKNGELAMPGFPLMQIVDLRKIYIKANVSEFYLSKVNVGDNTIITFPSFPSIIKQGKILRLGNVINPQNRTFEITLKIDNKNEFLKPNIVAVLRLRDFVDNKTISVPSMIIKNDITGSYLYRVKDSDQGPIAEKVYVKTGMTNKEMMMITDGIEFGDTVIIKGYNIVKNGSLIDISKKSGKSR